MPLDTYVITSKHVRTKNSLVNGKEEQVIDTNVLLITKDEKRAKEKWNELPGMIDGRPERKIAWYVTYDSMTIYELTFTEMEPTYSGEIEYNEWRSL